MVFGGGQGFGAAAVPGVCPAALLAEDESAGDALALPASGPGVGATGQPAEIFFLCRRRLVGAFAWLAAGVEGLASAGGVCGGAVSC